MLPKVLIGFSKVFATIWVLNIKFVNCIEIDNQLKVITNDCYERLAIGQRLKPQDIYKKVDANTVPKCQKECTIEGDNCKAFSYGIAIKGNSTCQLGKNFIRETADLQPIGTIADVDFDLYIKKLGCKLIVDPHVNKISKPNFNGQFLHSSSVSSASFNQEHVPSSTPSYPSLHQHGIKKPDERPSKNNDSSSNKPLQDVQKPTINYGLSIPNIETVHSSNGNYNNVKKPSSNSKFTQYGVQNSDWNYDVQHVQGSLVSISTGPLSYLHPVHEILIGKNPYLYGQTKPYRPSGNTPGESNFFNDKVGSYHTTNNMRPYDRYKDDYGISNEYFNDNPETYRDYSKYKNPNNVEATRNPEYDYNIFRRPGQSSYQQERPYVPSSNGYKDELPDRNKYNHHNRPFLEDPYDRYQPQQTNNFEYGSGKFTHEKDKPSYDTHRGYDDKRKRNPYDSEASKDKQKNPLGTPNNYFGSDNGGRHPMTSNVYNTDGPKRLSDSYNNKPGYYESHNQFFDERYPPRPIDYDNPQYGEKPLRPQHYGYGYDHQEYPPIIDDRKDGALNKRPYYGDHKTNYGSFDSSQGYPGPPKIHYSDQRPPRPHYNIWEPETRPVNSDYLFNDEVKYDSTRFVHPNSTFAVRKNDSTHSNDTQLFSHDGTKNNETHDEDSKLKPIVTESVGVDGEKIISIVTQLDSSK